MVTRGEGTVYVAAPLRFGEQMKEALRISEVLEAGGWKSYLSRRDGLEGRLGRAPAELLGALEKAAFALETFQIVEGCDSLVVSINGRVPDEGCVFKASLAFACGKPLVIYKRDHRTVFNGMNNSMVVGLSPGLETVSRTQDIPAGLERACNAFGAEVEVGCRGVGEKGPLGDTVERGRLVWERIERGGFQAEKPGLAVGLLRDIADMVGS